MKKIATILICLSLTLSAYAQGIIGAWETTSIAENGNKLKHIVLFADGYQVATTYNEITNEFIHTNGGFWILENNAILKKIEFDTEHPERVGTEIKVDVHITNNKIEIIESGTLWTRVDNGTPGALQGAWLMSGRVKDGETQLRDTSRPRKTMKVISGTRFQWIAYNTETRQFMGTGGGTYTTENSIYTEHIEFFSRDNSRVGLQLNFNYELIDGNWHHSGLSSKGSPIHEIWSVRTP